MALYDFDRFRLDPELHELRAGGRAIALQPKALALLAELVANSHRVLSKDELLERVWGDVNITESSLTRAMNVLRRALREAGAETEVVRTVRGRGYGMAVPVAQIEPAPDGTPSGAPLRAVDTAPDFVGREDELAALRGALDAAIDGRGGLALVSGDPGIGKSRLAREFAQQAEARGARVLWARGSQVEGSVAYGVWMQLAREASKGREAELRRLLGATTGDLAVVAPWLAPPGSDAPPFDAEHSRLRLFQGVALLFGSLAAEQPLVLLLDDLHGADAASLRLLEYVVHQLGRGREPLLVVATFRSLEALPDSALEASLAELVRAPCAAERIALDGLGAEPVARLLEKLGGDPPSPEGLAAMMERTGGNPLFVREWLQLVGAQGLEADTLASALPESVRQLIVRRLAELPESTRALLGLAAVIGRRFPAPLLARAAELPLGEALARLQPAEAARAVRATGEPGDFDFSHALFREALYGALTTLERVKAHARVGLALEAATRGHPTPPLSELAHHFGMAARGGEQRERALRYAERAAGQALLRSAFEEAAAHAEHLIRLEELDPPVDPGRRMNLQIVLADLRHRCGAAREAEAHLQQVLALAGETGSDFHAAKAVSRLSDYTFGSVASVPGERIALAEALLPRLAGDPHLQAELMVALASDLYWVSIERSRALNGEALALARRHRALGAHSQALGGRYRLLTHPLDADEHLRTAEEAGRFAREVTGDRHQEFYSCYHRLSVALQRARPEQALPALSDFERVARASRSPVHAAHVSAARVGQALLRGDLPRAEAGALEVFETVSATRSSDEGFLTRAVQLGTVRLLQGRLPELAGLLEEGTRAYPRILAFRSARMAAHLQAGEADAARRILDTLMPPGFEDFRHDFLHGLNLALCAAATAALRDAPRAERLYALLAPYQAHMLQVAIFCSFGSGDRYRALAARALDRLDDAIEHGEAALAVEARAAAPLFEARSCLELADAREARRGRGDAAAARSLRERAAALAAEHGRGWSAESLRPASLG